MAKDKSVICSQCEVVHTDNDAYLAHTCEVTGYNPTQPQHFGTQFLRNSKAALKRGNSLTKARETAIDAEISETVDNEVDHKIATKKAEKARG